MTGEVGQACGGSWVIMREVDCLVATCDRCGLAMDIGWAHDRYAGKKHLALVRTIGTVRP